jgi:predicted dehydrogenase
MTSPAPLRLAVLGGGMFFAEIIGPVLRDLERYGIAPYLGSIGQGRFARDLAPARLELVAVGTRSSARGTAGRIVDWYRQALPDSPVRPYYGDTVWEEILAEAQPDVLVVATPDDLHYAPVMAALRAGADVLVEKPLCLRLPQADEIIAAAQAAGRVVAADMHKRYDPLIRALFQDLVPRMGEINYVEAVLEEPLQVATEVFQWAARSNPFSYVGCHWTDVVQHYLGVRPLSVHATGQKRLLANWRDPATGAPRPIDTFDSMQVKVTYQGGMEALYVTAWINPPDFEGNVNQEIKVFGTRGSAFLDQQDRGLRYCLTGAGSRTANPLFIQPVPSYRGRWNVERGTRNGEEVCLEPEVRGYGKDSVIAGFSAILRRRLLGETPEALEPDYPSAASQRDTVALLDAAAQVAERNWELTLAGKGSPVTALLESGGVQIGAP